VGVLLSVTFVDETYISHLALFSSKDVISKKRGGDEFSPKMSREQHIDGDRNFPVELIEDSIKRNLGTQAYERILEALEGDSWKEANCHGLVSYVLGFVDDYEMSDSFPAALRADMNGWKLRVLNWDGSKEVKRTSQGVYFVQYMISDFWTPVHSALNFRGSDGELYEFGQFYRDLHCHIHDEKKHLNLSPEPKIEIVGRTRLDEIYDGRVDRLFGGRIPKAYPGLVFGLED
jgi:hypothetical protein